MWKGFYQKIVEEKANKDEINRAKTQHEMR